MRVHTVGPSPRGRDSTERLRRRGRQVTPRRGTGGHTAVVPATHTSVRRCTGRGAARRQHVVPAGSAPTAPLDGGTTHTHNRLDEWLEQAPKEARSGARTVITARGADARILTAMSRSDKAGTDREHSATGRSQRLRSDDVGMPVSRGGERSRTQQGDEGRGGRERRLRGGRGGG